MSHATLASLQDALADIYDLPATPDVREFLLTDRALLAALSSARNSDEQLLLAEEGDTLAMSLYIDRAVLDRLTLRDPFEALTHENLADWLTAAEGVSHFVYVAWNTAFDRPVTLLELELQAEVDKYATALALLTQQRAGAFPGDLHARMFGSVSFLPQLDQVSRRRYEEANRHAARYCRSLDQRYLHPRRRQPEKWLAELRRFFRCGHQEKIRQLALV